MKQYKLSMFLLFDIWLCNGFVTLAGKVGLEWGSGVRANFTDPTALGYSVKHADDHCSGLVFQYE
ncbi:hypothetical protein ACT3RT_19150 [Ewingella sp. AOP9-I1-14]